MPVVGFFCFERVEELEGRVLRIKCFGVRVL